MTKEEKQEYNKTYRHSYKGHVKTIYKHQIRNCISRKHPLPTYTEQELYDWYIAKEEHLTLHEAWKNSNYHIQLTPSVDRLDNSLSYTLENIELVTWSENKARAYKQLRTGVLLNPTLFNNGHRAIVKYSLDGVRLCEYFSIAEACRATGIDHRGISDACKGKRVVFHGFRWAYLDEEDLLIAKLTPEFVAKTTKRYLAALGISVTIHTDKEQLEFSTVKSAADYYKVSEHVFMLWANNLATPRSTNKPTDILKITLKAKSATNQ